MVSEGIVFIGYEAFDCCRKLKEIFLPSSLIKMDGNILAHCQNLTEVVIGDQNSVYGVLSGCIINKKTKKLICGFNNSQIPEGIVSIEQDAFRGCKTMSSIVIPDSVVQIDKNAFFGCSGLTDVVVPGNFRDIPFHAFGNCENLKKVIILGGIKK